MPDPVLKIIEEALPRAGEVSRSGEAALNDGRLAKALEMAIAALDLIPGEQAKYDAEILRLGAVREELIAGNAPVLQVEQTEAAIESAAYHRQLVQWQLERAAEHALRRKRHLEDLADPRKQRAEWAKCQDGLAGLRHWWEWYAWTADPRPDAPLTYVPFVLFDCQGELLQWIWDLVFVRHTDGHLDKSRDMGASWILTTFAAANWLVAKPGQPFTATFGSRKEEFVDKTGDLDTLLEKVRVTLRLIPGWQLPAGFTFQKYSSYLKISNPANSSMVKGESANENFARAGRQAMVVFDEAAAWPQGGYAAWTAASESTRTRLAVSTPQGKFNKFGELKGDTGIPHFSLHWRRHPWKSEQWYKLSARRMSKVERAQELDLDYEGSVAGRLMWMFCAPCSVITWSEFVDFFGKATLDENNQPRIPKGWKHRVSHDCGTTDDHPSVIIAAAMSPANSRLPNHLFFHEQIFHGEGAHPLVLAPIIKEKLKRYWADIEMWMISHEAEAWRLIYNDVYGLPFEQWDTTAGYVMGYPQMQSYFTPRKGKNPFRPQINGHPRAFIVVDDQQGKLIQKQGVETPVLAEAGPEYGAMTDRVRREILATIAQVNAKWTVAEAIDDESGFKRTRDELPQVHIPQSEAGKPVKAQRHFKRFDDAWDTMRAIAASLPTLERLTQEELVNQRLSKSFQAENLQQTLQTEGYQAVYAWQEERAEIQKAIEKERMMAREGLTGEPIHRMRDRGKRK